MDYTPVVPGYTTCGCYVGAWNAVIPPPRCAEHAGRWGGALAPQPQTFTVTTTPTLQWNRLSDSDVDRVARRVVELLGERDK